MPCHFRGSVHKRMRATLALVQTEVINSVSLKLQCSSQLGELRRQRRRRRQLPVRKHQCRRTVGRGSRSDSTLVPRGEKRLLLCGCGGRRVTLRCAAAAAEAAAAAPVTPLLFWDKPKLLRRPVNNSQQTEHQLGQTDRSQR